VSNRRGRPTETVCFGNVGASEEEYYSNETDLKEVKKH
jgi:hypothetical protein